MSDGLEYRVAVGRRFGERLVRGDCVAQIGAKSFAGMPCTVSNGEIKTLSHVNAFVGMQVMRDRGVDDPRFFTEEQINAAGWTLADNAVGIGLQYLSMADGERPVAKRFKVFHARDVTGCGAWERPDPAIREDFMKALADAGVTVAADDAGLAKAIHEWCTREVAAAIGGATTQPAMNLRTRLITTWLEAATGVSGLRIPERDDVKLRGSLGQSVIADPLTLYAAVGDAERIAAGMLGQVRAAQFERKTEQSNQKQAMQTGDSMGDKTDAPKVSAWVEKMFAQRQSVLAVPYSEKDRAQKAGAIWHAVKKLWFVPPNLELAAFKAWNPSETALGPTVSEAMLIDDFAKAMKGMDLILPTEIKPDGKWHNVAVYHGNKKKIGAGSYLINLEGGRDGVPCGSISNKASGERLAWRYEGALLTPEQRAKAREEARMREAEALREEKARHDVAALHAQTILKYCVSAEGHGYIVRKEIPAEGVFQVSGARLLEFEEFVGESGKTAIRPNEMYAIIPLMTANGEVRSLQAISPDGKVKTFMRGAQKSGLMYVLGGASLDSVMATGCPIVAYAEGMATSASFREGVSVPVVVCFDAGNMDTVVQATASRWPANVLKLLAVDNDQFHVERALGALARTVGVNPYSAGCGNKVEVVSRAGCDGLTGGSSRAIALGNVVADGEWHQAPKGKYCVFVEHEADGVAVRSMTVEMVPEDGRKVTQLFSNRGAEVGKANVGQAANCIVVSPWFDSLDGLPTDWNDLMMREGLDVVRERVADQVGFICFERTMQSGKTVETPQLKPAISMGR